jgi:hypothetical protein
MIEPDPRERWLQALCAQLHAESASLFERPPWNPSVRILSAIVATSRPRDAGVTLVQGGRAHAQRLEVELVREGQTLPFDGAIPSDLARLDERSAPPDAMLVSSLLHDLKNALGAQSLLLGSAERELRLAAEGGRALRFESVLESVALSRESVSIAADRAHVAQLMAGSSEPLTLSGEAWLRLSLTALGEERERFERSVSIDARTGPSGAVRALGSISVALVAMASGGERTTQRTPGTARLQLLEDELELTVRIAARYVNNDHIWRMLTKQPVASGRSAALIGLAEALASSCRFTFSSTSDDGTSISILAPRSSGVLR